MDSPRGVPSLSTLLVAFTAFSCTGTRTGLEPDGPPNIVLLMADDLGWGELGLQGHPFLSTPELDAMAANGLTFARFYAAAPVCSPTRASVLTGRHPNRTGCISWGHELAPREVTLAESLVAAGYATGHFGKWHVGSVRADDATSPGAQGFERWLSSPNFFDLDPLFSDRGLVVETHGEGSEVVMQATLDFIRSAARAKRPFLAVVWFGSPHVPHHARPADLSARTHVEEQLRAYCAEIEAVDHAVGSLRTELRKLGIERNTLVWFTSDNGPRPPTEPAEHPDASTAGLRGRKGTLWEGGLRVPTILEWPVRLETARKYSGASGTVDILPTVLDVAGAQHQPRGILDGESLAPVFENGTWRRAQPLGFWVVPAKGRVMYSDKILQAQRDGKPDPAGPVPTPSADLAELTGNAAWIDRSWKLLRREGDEGIRYALYDLAQDPGERNDLAGDELQRVRSMRLALEEWQRSVADDAGAL